MQQAGYGDILVNRLAVGDMDVRRLAPSMLKKKNQYPLTLRRVGTSQVYSVG